MNYTNITMQKNVLLHTSTGYGSKAVKYNQLAVELAETESFSVRCISANMNRRVKKLTALGFVVSSVVTPVSTSDELAFAEFVMVREVA